MNKYWQHFKTITKHRHKVMYHCFKCGLYKQGLLHDLSKYSKTEFWDSAKYYQGTSSPIDAEKKDKGYSLAWFHHRGRNPHHWEYWVDNLGKVPVKRDGVWRPAVGGKQEIVTINTYESQPNAVEIPYKYLIEMICDMVSAGQVYMGNKWTQSSPLEFYKAHENKWLLHENTKKMLNKYLQDIADFGLRSFYVRAKYNLKIRGRN